MQILNTVGGPVSEGSLFLWYKMLDNVISKTSLILKLK